MKLILQQADVRETKVKIMLAGGHAAMLVLPPEHPLLLRLLETVAAPAVAPSGSRRAARLRR